MMMPFHLPFYYQPNYYKKQYYNSTSNAINSSIAQHSLHNYDKYSNNQTKELNNTYTKPKVEIEKKNNSKSNPDKNYFFELFGLKLYFDDILLICIIFFLYQEGVKDDELFISLILLLLT